MSGAGKADDLAARIDGASVGVLPAGQGPEILDCAPRGPEHGLDYRFELVEDDIPALIDG